MDEKGDEAVGMDDVPEMAEGERKIADSPAKNIPLAAKLPDMGQDKGVKQYADAPAARVSLKAKLEAMKVKAAGADKPDRPIYKVKEVSI